MASCGDIKSSLKAPSEPATTDMTPVDISMAVMNRVTNEPKREWLFKIPKAYLRNKKTWNGGRFSSLRIQMALPDLRPQKYSFTIFAKDKGTPRYNKLMKKRNEGVSIIIRAGTAGHKFKERRFKKFKDRFDEQTKKNLVLYVVCSNLCVKMAYNRGILLKIYV